MRSLLSLAMLATTLGALEPAPAELPAADAGVVGELEVADAGTQAIEPLSWTTPLPSTLPAYDARRAEALYVARCAVCHGRSGDGATAASWQMEPRPRDFTRGVYKLRSTPTGELPTDADLFQTITRGSSGTAMPAWSGMPEEDRWLLVQRVKAFSRRFVEEPPTQTLVIGAPPPATPEAIARGRAAYQRAECAKCHGLEGRGDGPAAGEQRDDLGRQALPASLRIRSNLHGGSGVEQVFRTLATGMDGTPMPSYEGAMSPAELWDLAHFVRSLSEPRSGAAQ